MNGFDKWTSDMTSEQMARVMSCAPCAAISDICPLYDRCEVADWTTKLLGDNMHRCYEKLCEYFDKEVEA